MEVLEIPWFHIGLLKLGRKSVFDRDVVDDEESRASWKFGRS